MNNKADNIPFVHNYCDRWCERCRFVNRCAVGSSEKLLETELKMELANSEEERNKIVFQHVADNFAEAGRLLEKMIEEAGLDFEAIQKDAKENPYKEPALTFFISVKSQRACSGKQEDYYDNEEDLLQSDFNGSAKIALIATGRSIKAWEFLLKAFPEIDFIIIGYLAQLQKISRNLLLEFPDAKQFIRPGFDEEKYNYIK